MALSTGQLLLVRYVWKRGSHHYYVCRHYRVTTTIGVVTQNQVAAALGARDMAGISTVMAGAVTAVGVRTHAIKPVATAEIGSVDYNALITPYSNNILPPQVAAVVRLKLLIPTIRGNGRVYVPCPPMEGNDSDGRVSGVYSAAVAAALTPLTQQITVGGGLNAAVLIPVVWRRPGNIATRVTALEVLKDWGYQRRRSEIGTPTPAPFRSI